MKEQSDRTLYVKDIPAVTHETHVKEIFQAYGDIRKFTLPAESQFVIIIFLYFTL